MKYRIMIIVAVVALLFSACQPTPEDIIVQSKNNDKMDDIIKNIDKPEQTKEVNDIKTPTPTAIPNYNYEVKLADKLFLHADAKMDIPNGAWDIISVAPRHITQQEVNRIGEVLLGDTSIYVPLNQLSKEQLTSELVEYKRKWAEGERDVSEKEYNQIIKFYEKEIAKAPEKVDLEPATLELKDNADLPFPSCPNLNVTTYPKYKMDRQYLRVILDNPGCKITWHKETYNTFSDIYQPDEHFDKNNMHLTKEEAIAKAVHLLNELNIEDMMPVAMRIAFAGVCDHIAHEECRQAYVITFLRNVGENKMTYELAMSPHSITGSISGISSVVANVEMSGKDANYAPPLSNEVIEVCISDNGFERFEWVFPMEVKGALNSNVELLSFDEITKIFQSQIKITNIWDTKLSGWGESLDHIDIHVSRITLGYARIRKKDTINQFLIVPVWDFFGDQTLQFTEEYASKVHTAPDGKKYKNLDKRVENYNHRSFITINAIDGSIIDRPSGY